VIKTLIHLGQKLWKVERIFI